MVVTAIIAKVRLARPAMAHLAVDLAASAGSVVERTISVFSVMLVLTAMLHHRVMVDLQVRLLHRWHIRITPCVVPEISS